MNTSNTLPLPGPIAAARRGRRPQVQARQPTDAELICAIAGYIRSSPLTSEELADCIEDRCGPDAADRAYELIYDCAGDAMNCLWKFSPRGHLLPHEDEQQIPVMF